MMATAVLLVIMASPRHAHMPSDAMALVMVHAQMAVSAHATSPYVSNG